MRDKAYIVANEQQECEVLEKLERKGLVWIMGGEKPTEWVPNRDAPAFTDFPIVLIDKSEHDFDLPFILTDNGEVSWGLMYKLEDEEIVYDGRKEEQMSEKYVVSQEFMNVLEDWKNNLTKYNEPGYFIDWEVLQDLPTIVIAWWGDEVSNEESNNRLIAIIRWVNGEDVFEVEKTKKWVVRSKVKNEHGDFGYVSLSTFNIAYTSFDIALAAEFDTKEEAESWANAHQEVVEVEE